MQYCFACQSEVSFPHICPKLYGKADTHNFRPYTRKGLAEARGETGSIVKCSACGWVINEKDLENVALCPASKALDSTTTYTGLINGQMACPTCNKPMKKLFTSKDGKDTRYYCPKCAPLPK